MPPFAPRVGRVEASPSSLAGQRARELQAAGRDVIALTAGEPDFPTPPHVVEAAFAAARAGQTRYTNVDGTPALKQAVRDKFKRENGLEFAANEVIVANGGKQIIFDAFMATLGPGDQVLVPAPYWVSYLHLARVADGEPVVIDCPQNNGFKLRPEDLEAAITPRTRWLVLNNPGNPAGGVYTAGELRAIAAVLERHPDIWLMSDDIYEHFIFDGAAFATMVAVAPQMRERTLTLNGCSKVYSMTGWRIGYAGGPAPLIRNMIKMQSQSTGPASSVSQAAAVAALTGPQDFVPGRNATMQERRDLIVAMLNAAEGLSCHKPGGAFYVLCSCAGTIGKNTPEGKPIRTEQDFCLYLLEAADVMVVQGEAYGRSPYFRASFATSTEKLRQAGQRIQKACADLRW